MKKILLSLVIMVGILAACGQQQVVRKPSNVNENLEKPSLSNMANEASFNFVGEILKDKLGGDNDLARANVDKFMDMVSDYNKSVGEKNLIGDFKEDLNPTYDTGKLIENRQKAQKKFPDTNCRINAYLLAVANMKIQRAGNPDDEMLFMDLEKIKEGHLFDGQVSETFRKFFSRVPTDESKNPEDQAKVMEKYFEGWSFPRDASLVSVVIHDNLDGNYLFIGHIGVLVKTDEGYLFVEKISFEEPYQAIKFPNRQAVYDYLKNKFKDYTDPNTCPPFVMDNGEYVG
ncbi:DUF4300 family protein [uncultured Anaerococcus sp.]|uniref:DUF4300 family protein n=1 Tax=uncultured Anaerococcus sp. TaxID=293428 RepID=UPI00288A9537|nr:DUF4300 family protein [uncultured Anaerococcus sp.]